MPLLTILHHHCANAEDTVWAYSMLINSSILTCGHLLHPFQIYFLGEKSPCRKKNNNEPSRQMYQHFTSFAQPATRSNCWASDDKFLKFCRMAFYQVTFYKQNLELYKSIPGVYQTFLSCFYTTDHNTQAMMSKDFIGPTVVSEYLKFGLGLLHTQT